jgi:tetratricopeptide (TPR) repeat protein
MNLRRFLAPSAVAIALIAGSAGITVGPVPAHADSKGPTVRPEVGKPVQAARAMLGQKRYKEALGELAAADQVSGKTAYENYAIEATREAALVGMGDYSGAIRASEAVVASGQLSPAQIIDQYSDQVKLNAQIKNTAGLTAAINKYYQAGGTDPSYHTLVAQSLYQSGDLPGAARQLRSSLPAKPTEDQLKSLMGIDYKINPDGNDYISDLEKLVQYYPNTNYWHDLILAVQKKPGFSEKLELDVMQLKIATGVATTADDYMNAAQLALEQGFPGVAKGILDKGTSAGVLDQGAGAARQKKFADMADSQAASDQKTLAQEASQAHGGSALMKLGDSYASYGEYDQAVAAYQKAIAEGGPTAALAKLHMGLAYIAAGQKQKAHDALKSVQASDGTQDLATLWMLKAGV